MPEPTEIQLLAKQLDELRQSVQEQRKKLDQTIAQAEALVKEIEKHQHKQAGQVNPD